MARLMTAADVAALGRSLGDGATLGAAGEAMLGRSTAGRPTGDGAVSGSPGGAGAKYLIADGLILTPGALDVARRLEIEVLHPGPDLRRVLQRLAGEVTGRKLDEVAIRALETAVLAKIRERGEQ